MNENTKTTIKISEPVEIGKGFDFKHGTEQEHKNTLKRAKDNGVSYVWSGDLRTPYFRENLHYGIAAGIIEVEAVNYYEAQESGYIITFLK